MGIWVSYWPYFIQCVCEIAHFTIYLCMRPIYRVMNASSNILEAFGKDLISNIRHASLMILILQATGYFQALTVGICLTQRSCQYLLILW